MISHGMVLVLVLVPTMCSTLVREGRGDRSSPPQGCNLQVSLGGTMGLSQRGGVTFAFLTQASERPVRDIGGILISAHPQGSPCKPRSLRDLSGLHGEP